MSKMQDGIEQESFDDHLTFAEAAAILPRKRGKKIHPSTLWRWGRRGCKASNGEIIRLKHRRMGGTLTTTRADLNQFFAALAEADLEAFRAQDAPPNVQPMATTPPALRRAQVAHAKEILKAAGF